MAVGCATYTWFLYKTPFFQEALLYLYYVWEGQKEPQRRRPLPLLVMWWRRLTWRHTDRPSNC